MRIALDKAAGQCTLPELIQFRTPLTQYKSRRGVQWVLDNGCFTEFKENTWFKMVMDGVNDPDMLWFTMPDEVGNHAVTLNQFYRYKEKLSQIMSWEVFQNKAAFVIQDECSIEDIPWDDIAAVFLGGSTQFKLSAKAFTILKAAKAKGKLVHVGRVNTPPRILYFHNVADTIDGSGIAKYQAMLDDAIAMIISLNKVPQTTLF